MDAGVTQPVLAAPGLTQPLLAPPAVDPQSIQLIALYVAEAMAGQALIHGKGKEQAGGKGFGKKHILAHRIKAAREEEGEEFEFEEVPSSPDAVTASGAKGTKGATNAKGAKSKAPSSASGAKGTAPCAEDDASRIGSGAP